MKKQVRNYNGVGLGTELRNAGRDNTDLTEGVGAPMHQDDVDRLIDKYGQGETSTRSGKREYTLTDDDAAAELTVMGELNGGHILVDAEVEERNDEIVGLLDGEGEPTDSEPQYTENGVDVIR